MGFREKFHNLIFKSSETSSASGMSKSKPHTTPLSLEELVGPKVTISTPLSQIKAVSAGKVDFKAIFEAAGIVDANPFATAEKAIELRNNFSSLPETTQVESVEATLRTFGISEAQIVSDAAAKGEAIELYMQMTQEETTQTINRANEEIASLNQQVEAKKKELQERLTHQDMVNKSCGSEMDKYEAIIRFLASNDPDVQASSSSHGSQGKK